MGTFLKKWAPLFGSVILASAAILRQVGLEEFATALSTAGGLLGWTAQSPVGGVEFAALVANLWGVYMRLKKLFVTGA